MLDFSHFNSLHAVKEYFTTNDICKKFLAQQRWGNTVVCPHCGSVHCYSRKDGRYICGDCNKSFSVTSGTIFHNSNIPLTKWFTAMYEVSSHKKGISSCQLARDIDVTQKTAWFMLQKIRTLYAQDKTILDGEVEMDEMYLGGKEKWKHGDKKTKNNQGRSLKTKEPIFGMIQRDGKAVILHVNNTKGETLIPIIKEYVKLNAKMFTDEGQMYSSLKRNGYQHEHCDHANGQYVTEKGASTNRVEGFWSHFRRSIYGIYHKCSVQYIQRYIDEEVFRWNTRKQTEGSRFEEMFSKASKIVSYKSVRRNGVITVKHFSGYDYNTVMVNFIKGMSC